MNFMVQALIQDLENMGRFPSAVSKNEWEDKWRTLKELSPAEFEAVQKACGEGNRASAWALVMAHDPDPVTLRGADEGERRSRASPGVLDDGISRFQAAVCLRPRDHGCRHPILHAAGGVLPLELRVDPGAIGRNDLAKTDERGVPDGGENIQGRLSLTSL